MKSVLIILCSCFTLTFYAQTNTGTIEKSLLLFKSAINNHNGDLLVPQLDSNFKIGQIDGEMAKMFLRQFVNETRLKILSIKIKDTALINGLTDVTAIIEDQNGNQECHFLMDEEGQFHSIGLLSTM